MADIKEKIQDLVEEVVEKLKGNPTLLAQFKTEPVKALEKLIGKDLPDEQIEKVKAQLEKSGLEKQIDGLKDNFKKSCGIRAERIAFAYYTSDGKLIAEIAK